METHRTDTIFSTKAPRQNATEIVYVSHEDITELTIIVWTVGGVLLITLLALLGRIILARRKDPLAEMGYQRHRNNLFRIRIDSGYLPHPTEHCFTVPRDTNELVPGAATPPMESPVSQRYYSSSRSAQGNPRQENPQISINSNLPSTSSTTLNHSQSVDGANSINSNARSNIMFTNSNSMNSNAANDNGIECCAVYDAEISEETTNGNLEAPSINSALQQSISAIRSNMSPHATHSINSANNCQNTDHTQNSEIQPQCQLSQDNVLHRTQTQPRILSNGSTGSRAILSNGVVISPPPYCDVISTAARLPSVVVSGPSRPPSRRILFSL